MRRGEPNGVVDALDCILRRRRRAAGAAMGAGDLRSKLLSSILCKEPSEKGLGRCAGGRRRE
jgi:hypothetical protein